MKLLTFPENASELVLALEELKRDFPSIIEAYKLSAKLIRVKYVALVEEGFTPEQALELCKGGVEDDPVPEL